MFSLSESRPEVVVASDAPETRGGRLRLRGLDLTMFDRTSDLTMSPSDDKTEMNKNKPVTRV